VVEGTPLLRAQTVKNGLEGSNPFLSATKDPADAKRLFTQANAEIEARWANLERGEVKLSAREALSLARPFYDGMLAEFRDQPLLQTRWDTDIGATCFSPARPPSGDALSIDAGDIKRTVMEGWCLDFAGRRLGEGGFPKSDENVATLARAIAQALQAAALELKRIATVNVFPLGAPVQQAQALAGTAVGTMLQRAIPVKEIFDGWRAERKPTEKTGYVYEKVTASFMAFVGLDDVTQVTSRHVADWKAAMLAHGLSAKTIGAGKLSAARAVFQWAADNSVIKENPFAKVTISLKKKPGERKRGYSDDEAKKVLSAAALEDKAHLRWVPLLCAYTGARISEISQLRKQDVVEVKGLWCLQLVPEAGSLKNASSERSVPLHPNLVDAGFLTFVKGVKSGPIFSEVPPDRFGARGGNMTKLVSRWVRGLGITDPRVAPSHAWRHRFKTLCRRFGVSSDIGDVLTGHSARTVADTYGAFEVDALYRELCKLP
jgi:integrase